MVVEATLHTPLSRVGASHRRLVRLLAVLLLALALSLATSAFDPTRAAAVTSCHSGDPHWKKSTQWVDTYGRTVPARCGYWNGTKGWGVLKLEHKSRWTSWYRDMIGATLETPTAHWAQNSTTDVYVTQWFTNCDPQYRFRVVVNTSHKSGESGMMGVVNAYKELK